MRTISSSSGKAVRLFLDASVRLATTLSLALFLDGKKIDVKHDRCYFSDSVITVRRIYQIISIVAIAVAANVSADSIVTTAYYSDTGFGQLNFQPGVNVNEFVIAGDNSAYADSPGSTISKTITGDGTQVLGGPYSYTYFTWSGGAAGTTGGTSGTTLGVDPGSVEPISTGYGTTPYTTATLSLTAPSSSFIADLFVHDYYVNANLTVKDNGQTIGVYDNIMNSSGSRTTDFLFRETLSGVNPGDNLTFTFDGLQNLGSDWANINVYAASVNYTLPETFNSIPSVQLNNVNTPLAVPEPSIAVLVGLGGVCLVLRRRWS